MKYTHVDKEGNFEVKGDIRALYSVMMYIRVILAIGSGSVTAKCLTIALRYAAVRRQFSTIPNSNKERRLIDYQAHQFKLIPELANAYV